MHTNAGKAVEHVHSFTGGLLVVFGPRGGWFFRTTTGDRTGDWPVPAANLRTPSSLETISRCDQSGGERSTWFGPSIRDKKSGCVEIEMVMWFFGCGGNSRSGFELWATLELKTLFCARGNLMFHHHRLNIKYPKIHIFNVSIIAIHNSSCLFIFPFVQIWFSPIKIAIFIVTLHPPFWTEIDLSRLTGRSFPALLHVHPAGPGLLRLYSGTPGWWVWKTWSHSRKTCEWSNWRCWNHVNYL